MTETKKIPAAAFRMAAMFEIGDNGDSSATAPIRILARTGDPVISPYFDMPVCHDLQGMLHKTRIPLDWSHNPDLPLGYLNKFDSSTNDLICSGAITPVRPDDKASEVLAQSKAGIPFSASIDFRGDCDVEELSEGQQVQVNGRSISGPALIVRRWMLRGVALCLTGQDPGAYAQFSEGDTVNVNITKHSDTQQFALTHNNTIEKSEPDWGSVDKSALPRIAFADEGKVGEKSTWSYPHHYIVGGTTKDKDGIYTNGTLYLHVGGLNAAWSAANGGHTGNKANGGHTGNKASAEVIAHLQAHRKALGLDKQQNMTEQKSLGEKTMSEQITPVVETSDKPVEADAPEKVISVEGAVKTTVEDKVETEAKAEVVETSVEGSETKEAVVEEPKVEAGKAVETTKVSTEVKPESQTMSEGERFLQTFGDVGGRYFAEGKSFDQAMQLFVESLKSENIKLKAQLQATRGAAPVSFSESTTSDAQRELSEAAKQMTEKGVSPVVAQLAAAMQIHRKQKAK